VTLSTYLTSDDYAELLADCRARVLVAHASVMDRVAPIRGGLPHLRHVVVAGGDRDDGARFDDVIASQPDELAPEATTADDMRSGSTPAAPPADPRRSSIFTDRPSRRPTCTAPT